jgi:hypothetical protein
MPRLDLPREELFCQGIVSGLGPGEAFEKAGYTPNQQRASAMKGRPHIQSRIGELLRKSARKAVVTAESLCEELDEVRKSALNPNVMQLSSAVSAIMGKAKLFNIGSEGVRMMGPDGGPVEVISTKMTPLEAADLYARTLEGAVVREETKLLLSPGKSRRRQLKPMVPKGNK